MISDLCSHRGDVSSPESRIVGCSGGGQRVNKRFAYNNEDEKRKKKDDVDDVEAKRSEVKRTQLFSMAQDTDLWRKIQFICHRLRCSRQNQVQSRLGTEQKAVTDSVEFYEHFYSAVMSPPSPLPQRGGINKDRVSARCFWFRGARPEYASDSGGQ